MPVGGFKRIEKYTEQELAQAIEEAKEHCASVGLDFWVIHRGFFAYIEQRRRKDDKKREREDEVQSENLGSAALARQFEKE
jgi:hypothetical protein